MINMVIGKKEMEYLNHWADFDKHKECIENDKVTSFGRGYKQAVSDIWDYLLEKRNSCGKCGWISPKTKIKAEKCPKCGNKYI